jgi:hypothetical protein
MQYLNMEPLAEQKKEALRNLGDAAKPQPPEKGRFTQFLFAELDKQSLSKAPHQVPTLSDRLGRRFR